MDSEKRAERQLEILIERYPALSGLKDKIREAYQMLRDSYERGGKLLICGNGGSCADSEHIVGELMKGFCKKRKISEELRLRLKEIHPEDGEALYENLEQGLPAIALTAQTALNTAFSNDKNPLMIFAQQTLGYGKSKNVLYAFEVAKALGMKTIALTGKDGGKAGKLADLSLIAPSNETYQIQEYHLPIYHALCLMLEERYFGE